MEGRPRHRMSKKLQLAFSERRIRKGIYRMYARFRPYHLIGAIGGLTVDGATLNAKNNATQDAGFGTPGINTDLTAINGAKVNISSVNDHGICGDVIVSGAGTVVNASSASGEHYGIFAGQEDIFGELGGDQKGIFTISDGAVVTASGGKGAMRWKPDLSGYTDPVVAAGDSAAAEEIIGDPARRWKSQR